MVPQPLPPLPVHPAPGAALTLKNGLQKPCAFFNLVTLLLSCCFFSGGCIQAWYAWATCIRVAG